MMCDDCPIAECKRLERPSLEDWSADDLKSKWPIVDEERKRLAWEEEGLSKAMFRSKYEGRCQPCVVVNTNIASWTLEDLDAKFGDLNFRVSDTHGGVIGLREWMDYGLKTNDDAPFGIYDSQIFDDVDFLDYRKPRFLRQCAFTGLSQRPPWRWILLGAPRSGTFLHVDPLGTHAWVYLCQGRKLWGMLPPESDWRPDFLGDGLTNPGSANFFFRHRNDLLQRDDYVEFIQESGDFVYVPAGWRHAVLNLDWTVAVTENYAIFSGPMLRSILVENPDLFNHILTSFSLGHVALLSLLPNLRFFLPDLRRLRLTSSTLAAAT